MATPRDDGFAMPPEWAEHERTVMAWPARAELWGGTLENAKREYAGVANAIAAFEPLTMVARPGADAAEARAALDGAAEVVELPLDDSWVRDNGPIVLRDGAGRRAAAVFAFNAWGERFLPYDEDARLAGRLAGHLGLPAYEAGMVLEGGSVLVDGTGVVLTTEQCLLHPNRNPTLTREDIERRLLDFLGAEQVVWLRSGLVEDRDTDGHVDLIAAFTEPGRLLLQQAPVVDPNFDRCAENLARATAAGLDVIALEHLPRTQVAGEDVAVPYLNLYICNGGVIVPTCGAETDPDALRVIGAAFPGREVVGVPGAVLAYGGGGPHCITQQVPVA